MFAFGAISLTDAFVADPPDYLVHFGSELARVLRVYTDAEVRAVWATRERRWSGAHLDMAERLILEEGQRRRTDVTRPPTPAAPHGYVAPFDVRFRNAAHVLHDSEIRALYAGALQQTLSLEAAGVLVKLALEPAVATLTQIEGEILREMQRRGLLLGPDGRPSSAGDGNAWALALGALALAGLGAVVYAAVRPPRMRVPA